MDKLLSKNEVQAQLQAKSDEIARRIDALQEEVTSAPEALRKAIHQNPFMGVGGAVAGGLLVGLVFGGSKKKRKGKDGPGGSAHQEVVESYIRALAADARKAVKAGANTEEAVRKALGGRVPLVIYNAPNEEPEQTGFLHDTLDLVFKTALGFAVKIGIDYLTARFHLEDLAAPLQSHGGADASAPVAAFMSES